MCVSEKMNTILDVDDVMYYVLFHTEQFVTGYGMDDTNYRTLCGLIAQDNKKSTLWT